MRNSFLVIVAGTFVALTSCGQSTPETVSASAKSGGITPVETKEPNSAYKPAFGGQTRVAGIKSATNYEGRVVTEALKSPWGITSLPDGRLLITEREGTMRIVTSAGQVGDPIAGIPKVNPTGQGGTIGDSGGPSFRDKPNGILGVF
jgi:glucose/arabinose dehydrogenase